MSEEKENSRIRKPRMRERESGRKIVFNLSNIFSRLNRFIRAGFTFFTLFIRQKGWTNSRRRKHSAERKERAISICCVSYLLSLLCLMNLISELIFLLTLFLFAAARHWWKRERLWNAIHNIIIIVVSSQRKIIMKNESGNDDDDWATA